MRQPVTERTQRNSEHLHREVRYARNVPSTLADQREHAGRLSKPPSAFQLVGTFANLVNRCFGGSTAAVDAERRQRLQLRYPQ